MTTAARFVVVTALVLLAGSTVAQPPTAPPPHPPLGELVKEYVRLGLPLPPPGAPLVRIAIKMDNTDDRDAPRAKFSYRLGFSLPPTAPGKEPRYLIGYGRLWNNYWFDPAFVELAEPTPESLKEVHLDYMESIPLAVQCELRGWHKLADAIYGMARKQMAEIAQPNNEPMPNIKEDLRFYALSLIERPIDDPGSDRKAILERIKAFLAKVPISLSPQRKRWLHRLELTVAPRKSKPGTTEAMIDGLTEYWVDTYGWDGSNTPKEWISKGQEPYWKLAALGFDAVPALIEHLNDDRLSRTSSLGFNNFRPYTLTVGHLCSRLLCDLSARQLFNWELRGDRLEPEKARAWFAEARKVGEEKWLLDHAVPAGKLEVRVNEDGRPEGHIFRVIGAKYPKHIPSLYRAVLKKPRSDYGDYIDEILASKLPREQKIALFEEGLRNSDTRHRLGALKGLSQLDRPLFTKRLQGWLRELPDKLKKRTPDVDISEDIVRHVKESGDRQCWDLLLTATKASPYLDRKYILFEMGMVTVPDDPDPIRRERLRFFSAFLDDLEAVRDKNDDEPPAQVRDIAAYRLAAMFRFPVQHDWMDPVNARETSSDQGPLTRLLLREAVRELAKRELARPGK